jgi:cytochrome c biogenesis protein CcdA
MIVGLPESIGERLAGGNPLSLMIVLGVGFVSTLKNPCALPLYPAATAACLGEASLSVERRRTSPLNATAFVVGIALSTAVLGLAAVAAGRLIGIESWGRYLIAAFPILMGLHRLGWLPVSLPDFRLKTDFHPGIGGAFSTGFLLALVVGRCGSTVLGSILAYASYHHAFLYGGVLLFAYGLGAGIPLITFGTAAGKLTSWIDNKGYSKWTDRVLGAMMLLLGFYLLWLA